MIGIVDGGGGGPANASRVGIVDGLIAVLKRYVDCISKKARPTEQMTERQTVNFLMRPINLSA